MFPYPQQWVIFFCILGLLQIGPCLNNFDSCLMVCNIMTMGYTIGDSSVLGFYPYSVCLDAMISVILGFLCELISDLVFLYWDVCV